MAKISITIKGADYYTVFIENTEDNTNKTFFVDSPIINFTADVNSLSYNIIEKENIIVEDLKHSETNNSPISENKSDINNVFLSVPKEVNINTFSPEKFPSTTIPMVEDTYLQREMPTFLMTYEGYNDIWINKNTSSFSKGFFSKRISFNNCTDIWVEGCPGTYESFVSALPYNERFHMGILGNTFSNSFITGSPTETVYQAGKDYAGGPFGRGDTINNKTNFAIYSVDVETGLEVGGNDNDSAKLASMFAGMGDAMSGYTLAIYVISLFTYGHEIEQRYPNQDGSWNILMQSDEYPDIYYGLSKVWTNPFILNGETKYLKDYKNVLEVEEVAHYSEDSFEQGEVLYNSSNQPLRTINHFGVTNDPSGLNGYSVRHVISRGVCLVETANAFAKSQNRDFVSMFKVMCDRGDLYYWRDHTKYIDVPYPRYVMPRNIAFSTVLFTFMSGARGWHFWGSPSECYLDGYNGVIGASTYIFNKYNINGNQISLADLKPNLIFNTWNTEQSYDGGNSYVKHKAIDWKKSMNYLPLRTAYTNDGYVVVFASRPYNVEPLSCKWKVTIGGTVHTGDITSSDWQSCYPEHPDRKDFVFKIIKYNGNI